MKVWFNKIHDSRRSMVEITDSVIHIGRDPGNTIVLQSPLVSKRHAVVTTTGGKLRLENVGLNGCLVGDREVLGGESVEFEPGQAVRIWPYSLLFETETQAVITMGQMASHLRSLMANLELKIHRRLLERLDLYELESRRASSNDAILLLENHIEDICRELQLFGPENAPVLEEITGLTLHDYLINQLILEGGRFATTAPAGLTQNEFDIPATLIAERELARHPGSAIIYNLISSRTVPEVVERAGGVAVRSRVGHSFIKADMAAHDAAFGGEHSGHFYFRDFWKADSGILAALHLLAALGQTATGTALSEVLAPYIRWHRSGEINSEVADVPATLDRIRQAYASQDAVALDELDGLTVQAADWWFNVRPSNTEPLLRLNVEARTDELLAETTAAALSIIRGQA